MNKMDNQASAGQQLGNKEPETMESLKAQIAKLTASLEATRLELVEAQARELKKASLASKYKSAFLRLKEETLSSIKRFLDTADSSFNERSYKSAICEFTHAVVMASLDGADEEQGKNDDKKNNGSVEEANALNVEASKILKKNMEIGNDQANNMSVQAMGTGQGRSLPYVVTTSPAPFQQRNNVPSTFSTTPPLSPRQPRQGSPRFPFHQPRQFHPYQPRGPPPAERFFLNNNARRMNTPPRAENWQQFYNNNGHFGFQHQPQRAPVWHEFPLQENGGRFPETARVNWNPDEGGMQLPFNRQ